MIGEKTQEVEAFWQQARREAGIAATEYHAKSFAEPEFSVNADKIGHLARTGQKRGTAHLEIDFELSGVPRRKPGDYLVALDGSGKPLCVVRILAVEVLPFEAFCEGRAAMEGEGDLTLDHWARGHEGYFRKQLDRWGREWRPDLPVVFEMFGLVWPKPPR